MNDATQTITFNTGRKYTAKGQRITATEHSDGIVTFWDHDRHIDGQFALGEGRYYKMNATTVLAAYDAGHYTSTARSHRDGMMHDGVNASHNLNRKEA